MQNTDINNLSTKNIDIWSSIKSNIKSGDVFLNLYKRTHKLSIAIFLVSDNIEGNDFLKSKIKELSSKMLSLVISFKDNGSYHELNKNISEFEKVYLELLSFLDISSVSGFISKMNADIIKNELNNLIMDFGAFKSSTKINEQDIGTVISSGDKEAFVAGNINVLDPTYSVSDKYIKDINLRYNDQPKSVKRQNKKSNRKSLIYEFILKHNGSSIKDILPNIKGCSEKTIQREIIELIKDGKLRKEGERRWSRYFAIQQQQN